MQEGGKRERREKGFWSKISKIFVDGEPRAIVQVSPLVQTSQGRTMDEEVDAAMPPELLRQAVMPMIALHGMVDMHPALAKHMPLIRAVDIQQLPPASSKSRRTTYEGYHPAGILKQRWLQKHVIDSASAIAALVPWCPAEEGDNFDAVMERINTARQVVRRQGVLVVVVVVATGKVPDDVDQRFAQLHRTAELDGRLAALLVNEPDFALRLGAERLQHMLMEAAWGYMEERVRAHATNRSIHNHTFITPGPKTRPIVFVFGPGSLCRALFLVLTLSHTSESYAHTLTLSRSLAIRTNGRAQC